MSNLPITIYHNPNCGTSRNVLAIIRASGVEPKVVEYLKTGWTRKSLGALLTSLGVSPRAILRTKGTPAADLGLLDPATPDAAILDAMIAHPILVERPIVVTAKGASLCRPSERVLALLDNPPAEFTKEDGEVVRP